MATRNAKLTPVIDAEDLQEVHDWAIIETGADAALWEKPTTGETVWLPLGTKPTPRMIRIATLNGAVLRPQTAHEPASFVDDLDDEPSTPVDRVMTLLQSTVEGTRAEVKIYRVRDGDKDVYCGFYTPEQFEQGSLELIRSHFGGGKYRIKVYATNPDTGKFAVRMNETIEIEQSALPSALGGAQSNPMEAVMRKLDAIGNAPVNSAIAVNPMAQMKDMFQMMMLMKQLMGNDAPRSSVGEIATAIRELKDISGELGGGSGSGGGLMEMGTQLMSMIAEARQNAPLQPMQQAAPIPQIQARPNPIPQIHESEPEHVSESQTINQPINFESDGDMTSMFVKMAFKVILKKAAENAPVEPIAKDLYAKLPDDILDMLETSMWFDALKEFAPDVAQHEVWFTALREAVLLEIANDNGPG